MYKEIVKPTLVLVVISVVISALLAVTYNVAGIAELGKGISSAELTEYMPQVLPTATKLENTNKTLDDPDFLGLYKDKDGAGVAIHVMTKGYGEGKIKMLVGIDSKGAIAGIVVLESLETPNIGEKATKPEFLKQFIGKSGEITISKDKTGDIDAIAGATVTSKAMTVGVNKALEIYETVKGEI